MTEQASEANAASGHGWNDGTRWTRRLIAFEVAAVLAVGLGRSAVNSLISFVGSITVVKSITKLSTQAVALNASASSRPWLNLTWQVYGIAFGLAPALLVAYLATLKGEAGQGSDVKKVEGIR